jgi:NADP-dependent 3-hydroxy acid dehydrogenase YdfG
VDGFVWKVVLGCAASDRKEGMESLRGKIVFVTGASAGIGLATAKAFAALGAKLLICGRRLDRLTELVAQLEGADDVYAFKLDVQDHEAVTKTLADLPEEWKAVEVLVNNAGLSRGLRKMYEDDPQDWEEMIDTNVKGLLYVTRALVPGMVARGSGHVISLGSTAGHQTYANGGVYCATKAAERVISEGLRIDLIGTGVRVTSIDPGMVETEFSEVRFRGDKQRAAQVYASIRPLQPEDVAEAIVWAATRPARVQIQTVVMTTIDQANSTVFNRKS